MREHCDTRPSVPAVTSAALFSRRPDSYAPYPRTAQKVIPDVADELFFVPALEGPAGEAWASAHVISTYTVPKFSQNSGLAEAFILKRMLKRARQAIVSHRDVDEPRTCDFDRVRDVRERLRRCCRLARLIGPAARMHMKHPARSRRRSQPARCAAKSLDQKVWHGFAARVYHRLKTGATEAVGIGP